MDASASTWNGRRVFVAGCTGFLGGAVTRELLQRGAKVVGLVRDRTRAAEFAPAIASGQLHIVHGRAEDEARLHSAMAVHEVTAAFFLAPVDCDYAPMLRAARAYHSRLPVVTARPTLQYRIAEDADRSQNPLGVARFGELFGPRDRKFSRIVPRTVLSLLSGRPLSTAMSVSRDFVFIRDAARACVTLVEVVARECRSIDHTFLSGWELTDSAMSAAISNVSAGRHVELGAEQPFDVLGWRPESSLRSAIVETVDWYRTLVSDQSAAASRQAA